MRNEATTRRDLIDPKIAECGWGYNITTDSTVDCEHYFTDGRLIGSGQRAKPKKADYLLSYKNQKLAIIEAKQESDPVTQGLEQVKDYAKILDLRFVYSTNGHGIYFFDMETGKGQKVEKYHSPEELYNLRFNKLSTTQLAAISEPFHKDRYSPRYYQEIAINKAVSAISSGSNRILLNLATGTGKTFIAFQIVWKLYQSKWNKRGDGRRPRILFLADRNTLVEQAMGDFNALENEIVRITGKEVRKHGGILTNGNIFFSIYQALTSDISSILNDQDIETEDSENAISENPIFKQYPSDFFDLIIIDECHRGGASKEGNWRAILDHFSGATHLGLTATPKRSDNINTYEYFGEPLYKYSLKDGIEDGFLTPFKIRSIQTSMDTYTFEPGDEVVSGDIEIGKEYTLSDLNRSIYLPRREKKMTEILLNNINPEQKTIVFCNDERHAAMIRDYVNELKTNTDPDYCVRITASEGEIGDQYLRRMRDNDKTIPTIATTSRKLSTGIDARNIRFVVLMRPVGSMTEFKQIIGRGTRLYDNKDYFTIVDFYGNDSKFSDPEWDGEPAGKIDCPVDNPGGVITVTPPADPDNGDDTEEKEKTIIDLPDGRVINIQYEVTTRYYFRGKAVTPQEFVELLYGELPRIFSDENELKIKWQNPQTRAQLLAVLANNGFESDKLKAMKELLDAKKCDVLDILMFLAGYSKEIMPRSERVRRMDLGNDFSDSEKNFANYILQIYINKGESELTLENIKPLIDLKYGTYNEATKTLGDAKTIVNKYLLLQKKLYQ